ncbi:MAG: sugar phosphate isomerase/epimerase [Betaproteobacteria bacterium]|nr:sugar phosphate isomerase/epimerase [Betaproteobacteria bacterium]
MMLSLCNEVLGQLPFEEQCRLAQSLGYGGLELAPFTVSADPSGMTIAQARQLASIAQDHGLVITGLHWLLVKPEGLSITHPDADVRQRTVGFMQFLCELCAAMGGRYLVHGSPKQRLIHDGDTHAVALARATDCWAKAAQAAQRAGVTYCIEPLSADQTPLVNTLAQAVAVVQSVNHPHLRTMLDTSSAGLAESVSLPDLIDQWFPTGWVAHVQLNDPNRRGPGQGVMAFGPILAALKRQGYRGPLAVEPFDYVPDGLGCAARAAGYLQGLWEQLA